jgi:hypothetical protein
MPTSSERLVKRDFQRDPPWLVPLALDRYCTSALRSEEIIAKHKGGEQH